MRGINAGPLIEVKFLQITFVHIGLVGKSLVGYFGKAHVGAVRKAFAKREHGFGRPFGVIHVAYANVFMPGRTHFHQIIYLTGTAFQNSQ